MKIPLTPVQVDQLIAALDMDGDGDIDFGYVFKSHTILQLEFSLIYVNLTLCINYN